MKAYILVLIAISLHCFAVSSDDNFDEVINNYNEYIENAKKVCVDKSGASTELVEKLIYKGDFVENIPLKQFLLCIYTELGIVDENGTIDGNKMISFIGTDDTEINKAVYEKCSNLNAESIMEKMWLVGKCTYNTVKSLISRVIENI
ncbi:hypothetical protein FQA39_LY08026 [Lamprigera yunnana]|nr:hypothetical protein FQA39_LY08026 [Lamprigera yunnana]